MPVRRVRSKETISYTMSQIRSKDTSIEIKLRSALWQKGLQYRKHYSKVVGSPDIAFVSKKVAVFCDSSFWHGRHWAKRKPKLKSNRDYWVSKIERNMKRDRKVNKELKKLGWVVLRFWDIQIEKDLNQCIDKVIHTLVRL